MARPSKYSPEFRADAVALWQASAGRRMFKSVADDLNINVFLVAHLRPGESVLLHGGASGIGTMAIQLAKAVGAKVLVTVGSAEKLARCAELGADVGINYREQDFVEAVREATGGAGVDVILDIMGAKYLQRNVDALAVNGRLGALRGQVGGRPAVGETAHREQVAGGEPGGAESGQGVGGAGAEDGWQVVLTA